MAAMSPAAHLKPSRPSGVAIDADAPFNLRTLYIVEAGAAVRRRGERIFVEKDGRELAAVPIEQLDQVHLAGEGSISFGALRWCARHGIGVMIADIAGQPCGMLEDPLRHRTALRRRQYERAADPKFALAQARAIVHTKIANSRILLRRYHRQRPESGNPHDTALGRLARSTERASAIERLRGIEGAAARHYFAGLAALLAPQWAMSGRNRQPPRDPVNALLSYGYGILYHTMLTAILRCGLDPHVGALHAAYPGHASLASDLMEEFRAAVVDACVLRFLLEGQATAADFEFDSADYPVRLGNDLRRRFIAAMERKLGSTLACPHTGRSADYRRVMLRQAGHWAAVVAGEAPVYRPLSLR